MGNRKKTTLEPCSTKKLNLKTGVEECTGQHDKKAMHLSDTEDVELKDEDAASMLPGIPVMPPIKKQRQPGVIFVLENASLSPAYVGRVMISAKQRDISEQYQILNPDEHAGYMRKKNMDPYKCRPDIVYQALRQIFNSRLCMTGGIEAIFIKTEQGALIRVDPRLRLPDCLSHFCALISQLLQKFNIRATGKRGTPLRLVKNPVTQYFPINSQRIGFSFSSEKLVHLRDYVSSASNDLTLIFIVGVMAHGKIDVDYIDDFISVSNYQLSAATCLRRICQAVEYKRKIF